MKHVDNCLDGMEAEWLDKHLMKCEKCREDIVSYEAILGAIMAENEDAVPDELESLIMGQICELSLAKTAGEPKKEAQKTHTIISVTLAALVAASILAILRWDTITQLYLAAGAALEPARYSIDSFMTRIYAAGDALDMLFDRLMYGILFAIVALVIIQLNLWKKDRAAG